METKSSPPLFARILLGVAALVLVGVVYWFLSKALESLPMATVPPPRKAQSFNPQADVAKNPVFPQLQGTILTGLPDMPMGRDNPFVPIATTGPSTIPAGGLQVEGTKLRIMQAPAVTTTQTEMQPSTSTETVTSSTL